MKKISLLAILAVALLYIPAAFAQDQSAQPSSSPSASPAQTSPSQSSPAEPQAGSGDQTGVAPSQSPAATTPEQTPSATSPSSSQTPDQSAGAAGSASPSANSFTGTVTKSGDKYVLQTDSGTTYQLDDQSKAQKYEGQKVTVNGSLDQSTSTLHVTDINPASSSMQH